MERTAQTAAEPTMWATALATPEVIDIGDARLQRWTLAALEDAHAAAKASLTHLKPWMPWATEAAMADDAATREFIERSIASWTDRTTFNYAVVDSHTEAILGSCGLMGRAGPGALEIGYWIHVDHTRRGLATRAAAALTEAGLALPDVDRIEIHHDSANTLSGRVPPRLGYVRLREAPADMPAPGGTGVHVIWGMDRAAWPDSAGAALLAGLRLRASD